MLSRLVVSARSAVGHGREDARGGGERIGASALQCGSAKFARGRVNVGEKQQTGKRATHRALSGERAVRLHPGA